MKLRPLKSNNKRSRELKRARKEEGENKSCLNK